MTEEPHVAPVASTPAPPGVRRAVVVGAARSGLAAARALARRGVQVVVSDAKDAAALGALPNDSGITYALGGHPAAIFDGADLVVSSPGVPPSAAPFVMARELGIPIVPEVELAFRLKGPGLVFGITGTNGKSTTTALAAALLTDAGFDAIACGNIGLPWCEAIDRPLPNADARRAYVVELSSFQLEHVSTLRCDAAALLNVTPDHLDRHPSFPAYLDAKLRIFERQRPEDFAVVNADDGSCSLFATTARRLRFSRRRRIDRGTWAAGEFLVGDFGRGSREFARREHLHLVGDHNVQNALAALALTAPFGVDGASAGRTFARFRALPHRCAHVRTRDGVAWYDDSKGTNVDATLKALSGFPTARVWAILGGKDKGDDFSKLAPLLDVKGRRALLIGAAAEAIERALYGARAKIKRIRCGTLEAAVAYAAGHAAKGDVVLLSPACASFDQFRNYEHRGDVFAALVRALPLAEVVAPSESASAIDAVSPTATASPSGTTPPAGTAP